MSLQETIEQTVTGLGYDLVEIERSAGGLLRVTIDWPWVPGQDVFVTVEDCEKVTRQLQFVLEVEAVDYKRLEVSSPGIDRPLRHEKDFERFAGELVDITLKAPMGDSAGGLVHANRKKISRHARARRGTCHRLADQLERRAAGQARTASEQETGSGAPASAGLRSGRTQGSASGQCGGFQGTPASNGWLKCQD